MRRALYALIVYAILAATAQAELFDYFRKPSGLYVSTSVMKTTDAEISKLKVSELDFRSDNTFTWREHDVNRYDRGPDEISVIIDNISGTWSVSFGTGRVVVHIFSGTGVFIFDEGDLIEQQWAKRRFVKKNNAEAH